jgi:hypothetical protein
VCLGGCIGGAGGGCLGGCFRWVISVAVAVVVAAVDAVDVGVVNVGAVDVGAVDVGPWWGCLAGRSFPDGRRKIIRSQQQRSSNEKEIRTFAPQRNKFASI